MKIALRVALISISAAAGFVLSYTIAGFGSLYYTRLAAVFEPESEPRIYVVKTVEVKSPSSDLCVTNSWRQDQGLPPRQRFGGDHWHRSSEPEIWCLDQGMSYISVESEMHERRAATLLTEKDAPRQFWIVLISAFSVGAWTFLVCVACVDSWFLIPSLNDRRARVSLCSSTCFAASVLCVLPKLMGVVWGVTFPWISFYQLNKYQWFPWSVTSFVTKSAAVPAAWSLLTAVFCWLAIASIRNSMSVCARYSEHARRYEEAFSRFLLWSVPVLFLQYIAATLILERPLTLSSLAPW